MVVVVTDQGSEFKGVFEQEVEGMSVFQQAANTEAAWENGPTERCHATIQEQYELARSSEPQTQANRDELIVQCSSRTIDTMTTLDSVRTREYLALHRVCLAV